MKKTNLLLVCILFLSLGTIQNTSADLGGIYFNGDAGKKTLINCLTVDIQTGVFTVECWVLDAIGENGSTYMSTFNESEAKGFRLFVEGGAIAFRNTNTWNNNVALWIPKDNYIGKWTHYAAVADGQKIKLYVNGELKNEADAVYQSAFPTTKLTIGNALWETNPLVGKIADVRLWNTARTEVEIAKNYNKELTGTETGLYGYWKFNEQSGNMAANLVGTNNYGWWGDHDRDFIAWGYANKVPGNIQFEDNGGQTKITWESGWDTEWEIMINENSQAGLTAREHTASLDNGDVIKIRSTIPTVSEWAEKIYTNGTTNLNLTENSVDFVYGTDEIRINASDIISTVAVYSLNGTSVYTLNTNDNQAIIETSILSKGVYLVMFEINGKSVSRKYIK